MRHVLVPIWPGLSICKYLGIQLHKYARISGRLAWPWFAKFSEKPVRSKTQRFSGRSSYTNDGLQGSMSYSCSWETSRFLSLLKLKWTSSSNGFFGGGRSEVVIAPRLPKARRESLF
jgi:hypothetical protein